MVCRFPERLELGSDNKYDMIQNLGPPATSHHDNVRTAFFRLLERLEEKYDLSKNRWLVCNIIIIIIIVCFRIVEANKKRCVISRKPLAGL